MHADLPRYSSARKLLVISVISTVLSGCGGGSGAGVDPAPPPASPPASPPETPPSTEPTCAESRGKDRVVEIFSRDYLWNDEPQQQDKYAEIQTSD